LTAVQRCDGLTRVRNRKHIAARQKLLHTGDSRKVLVDHAME
jgi:hypothetical protein